MAPLANKVPDPYHNTIQLSLLHFFCVTRLGTAKSCQFSVS